MEVPPPRAPPPTWINKDLIQAALNADDSSGSNIVTSCDVSYASEEGSGFLSRLFQVAASVKKEGTEQSVEKRMLVKCSAADGLVKDETDNAEVFKVETLVLSEVMPQVHRALAAVEGDAFRPLAARCPHWGRQPAFLVLEDLTASGFVMAEAGRPLDYEHSAAVLRAYARLHAASAWLLKTRPDYQDRLRRDPLVDAQDYVKKVVAIYFRAVANQLKSCPGYTKYVDKLSQMSDAAVDKMLAKRTDGENEFQVLLHGDCWKNNLMFKYEGGKVAEVRLLDFQLCTVGSLAADLQHLLYSSASEEVHRRHLDRLLREYHHALLRSLRALGLSAEAERYTWQRFLAEVQRADPVGFVFSTFHVVFMSAEAFSKQIANIMNDPLGSDQFFELAYKNPYSLPLIKYVLPLFESKGLI